MVHKNQKGFTILELMIAISVFTIAIMLITVGVMAIGRYYQQGATKAKLLTAAREIHSQFTQEVQYNGADVVEQHNDVTISDVNYAGTYDIVCIGNIRYLKSSDTTQTDPNYGEFITDNNGQDCASSTLNKPQQLLPVDSSNPSEPYNSSLAQDTKVVQFDINTSNPYTLTTRFVIGTRDMFVGNDYNNSCQSNILDSEFCAVISLTSTVAQKVIN